MICITQGETLPIEINVTDSTGENTDLTGSTAIFSYKGTNDSEPTNFLCTIAGSVVSTMLTAGDTATMTTVNDCEIKIKDSLGSIRTVYSDQIFVKPSIIPNFDAVKTILG